MLEITCQGSDVELIPMSDDRYIIRAVDAVAGIVVNIPVPALVLAAQLPATLIALAA